MPVKSEYHCYTDGACKAGPGAPGGWGYVMRAPGSEPREAYGKALGTHAKVMEFHAVAEVVCALPEGASAVVFCDNQSMVESLSKQLGNWRTSRFVNVDPAVVDSARRIADAITDKRLSVRFQWLRAHNGNAGNERADALAAQGAREAKAELPKEKPRRGR